MGLFYELGGGDTWALGRVPGTQQTLVTVIFSIVVVICCRECLLVCQVLGTLKSETT